MVDLRDYQLDIIEAVRQKMRSGKRRIVIQLPTGGGKTALTANMLGNASLKGVRSWFIVHRRELVQQSINAFRLEDVRYGVVATGFGWNPKPLVQICSIGTLARRYGKIEKPQMIVWDECHHIAAGTWARIFRAFPGAYHIGLTATPQRLDGKGLDDWFDVMVQGPSVSELIEGGYLADYKMFAPSSVTMDGVKKSMGDFQRSATSLIMNKPTITGSAIREYQKAASGKRAVVFCVSIVHSQAVTAQFNAAGIPAAHIDGNCPTSERDYKLEQFRQGKIKVLCNVELFGEGFDLPAIECGILLRPTQSLGLYLQQVGRVLRPSPGKDFAILLDHVGNCERHGLPDSPREWSLKGRAAGTRDSVGPAMRICQSCFAAQPQGAQCRFCKVEFEIKSREIDHVEGDLVEMNPELRKWLNKKEQRKARTEEELVELGEKRGYRRPRLWARHVFRSRSQRDG